MYARESSQYKLLAPVAYGIWEALDQLERRVAVKLIDMAAPRSEGCKSHAETLVEQPVQHENLAQIYACFLSSSDRYLWLVSQLSDMGSMQLLLQARWGEGLGETAVCGALEQVARGLAYLHEQQFVHRDVCAANILVSSSGLVRLSFGTYCVPLSEGTRDLVGSLTHAAPEVVWGTDYAPACDIWSLGITALELLRGDPPNAGLSPPLRIVQAIVHNVSNPLPSLA